MPVQCALVFSQQLSSAEFCLKVQATHLELPSHLRAHSDTSPSLEMPPATLLPPHRYSPCQILPDKRVKVKIRIKHLAKCEYLKIVSKYDTCRKVDIHSVRTATLLRLVPTAVHVTLRLLWRYSPWNIVSTVAFFWVLEPGVFIAFLEASLLTGFNSVLWAIVCSVGKVSVASLIVLKACTIS